MTVLEGGEKLKAKLREIAEKADQPATLEVGFMEGATYPDGTSVALVAATNEFGVPAHGQPPRPFFRNMIKDHGDEWGGEVGKLLVENDYDAVKTLELMGEEIQGELVESIQSLVSPPLKQSTIDRKGFDKPLIDTSWMWRHATYRIKT